MRLPSRVLLALFVLMLPTVAAPPRSLAQATVVKLATLVPEDRCGTRRCATWARSGPRPRAAA